MPYTSHLNRRPHKRLKQLRKVCGITQEVLAKKIGVSLATIVAIETGSLQLSENLARRIMIVTGVDPHSLLNGPNLTTVAPEPFTEETYRAFSVVRTSIPGAEVTELQGAQIALSDEKLRAKLEQMKNTLEALAIVAAKTNHFHVFKFMFRQWISETIGSLKLDEGMKQLWNEPAFVSFLERNSKE